MKLLFAGRGIAMLHSEEFVRSSTSVFFYLFFLKCLFSMS